MTAPWVPPLVVINSGDEYKLVNSFMMGPPNLYMNGTTGGSVEGLNGNTWKYNQHPFVRARTQYAYWPGTHSKNIDTFRMTRGKYASVYTDDYAIKQAMGSVGSLYNGYPDDGFWPKRSTLEHLFEFDWADDIQLEANAVGPVVGSMHLRFDNDEWNDINSNALADPGMVDLLDEHETDVSEGIPYWDYYVKDGIPANDTFVNNTTEIDEMFITNGQTFLDHFTYYRYWPTGSDPSMDRFRVRPVYNFFISYEEQIADIPDGAEILLPNFYMFETALRTQGIYHSSLTLNNQQLFSTQTNAEWFNSHAANFSTPGASIESNGQYFASFGEAIASTPTPLLSAQMGVFANKTKTLAVLYSDLDILNKYDIRDEQSMATDEDDIMAHIYYPFYNKIEIDDGSPDREDWYGSGDWSDDNNSAMARGLHRGPLSVLLHYLDTMPGLSADSGYMFIDYMQAYVADRYKNFVGAANAGQTGVYEDINFDSQSKSYARSEKYKGNQEYTVYLDLENMVTEFLEQVSEADLDGDGGISYSPLIDPSPGGGPTAGYPWTPTLLLNLILDPGSSHPNEPGLPATSTLYRSTNVAFLRDYEDHGYPNASVKYGHHVGPLTTMMNHIAAGTSNMGALKVVGNNVSDAFDIGAKSTSFIRGFKDIVLGTNSYFSEYKTGALSDVIFYVIEKSIVAEDGTTSAPIQKILISPNFGKRWEPGGNAGALHYYDTQVRYGVRYKYEVKQLRIIFGNEYEYTGITTAQGIGTGYGRALGNALGYFKDEQNYPPGAGLYQPSLDNPAYQQYWLPEDTNSDWSTNPTSAGQKALFGVYLFEPANAIAEIPGYYHSENGMGPSLYNYLHPEQPIVMPPSPPPGGGGGGGGGGGPNSGFGELGGIEISQLGSPNDPFYSGGPIGDDDTDYDLGDPGFSNAPMGGYLDQSLVPLIAFKFNARGGWGLDGNYDGGLVAGDFYFHPLGDVECPDEHHLVWVSDGPNEFDGYWTCIPNFPATDEAGLIEEELLWDLSVDEFMDEFNEAINVLNTSDWEIGVEDFAADTAAELQNWFTQYGAAGVPPGPVGQFIFELIDAGVFSGPGGIGGSGPGGGGPPIPPGGGPPPPANFLPPTILLGPYTQFMAAAATNGLLQTLQVAGLPTTRPDFSVSFAAALVVVISRTNLLHNLVTSPAGASRYGTSPLANPLVARALFGAAGNELAALQLGSLGGRSELAYQLLTQLPAGSSNAALLQGLLAGNLAGADLASANAFLNESALDLGFGSFTVGAIRIDW